jgi:F0F1-type ATP synthase assembly protein I
VEVGGIEVLDFCVFIVGVIVGVVIGFITPREND